MRHRVAGRMLSRTTGHRQALFKNLMTELVRHGRIKTTEAKAQAIQSDAEQIISLAKQKDVHSRRQVARTITEPELVTKLFDEIGPRYAERTGGYTRIIKLGPRRGDNSEMVVIELVA